MTVHVRTSCRVPRLLTAPDRALVFRRCLEALAEPGEIRDLAAVFTGRGHDVASGIPVVSAPLLVLSDLLTPLAAMPGDDAAQEEVMRVAALTHAPVVAHGSARLVLALRSPARADVLDLPRGTPWEPHTAALVCVGVERVGGREASRADVSEVPEVAIDEGVRGSAARTLRLAGPGIPGSRELDVDGLGDDLLSARAEAIAFPLGFDVLLIDPDGRVAGLPRTTSVEVTR